MVVESRRNVARSLRGRATEAEKELWRLLRARLPLQRTYFHRQVVLAGFIVDFACFRHRVVIELDGSQHGMCDAPSRDAARTKLIEAHGLRVLRFWNHQVLTKADAVLDTILAAIGAKHPATEEPMAEWNAKGVRS